MAHRRVSILVACAVAGVLAVGVLIALDVQLRIVGAAFLAVAGAVGAVWGATKATIEAPPVIRNLLTKPEHSAYAWTPNLGLEFWQDGQRVLMRPWPEAPSTMTVTQIVLRPEPFTVRISNLHSARAVQLAVSRDERLFHGADADDFDPIFFWPGTGGASTQAGNGAFLLCGPWRDSTIQPPHNYFNKGGRLRHEGAGYEVYLSRPQDRPDAGFEKGERYFAIAGLDSDRDGRVSRRERELLVWEFR